MGILSGNPKDEPLHYGEIFYIWSYSAKKKSILSTYQLYLSHAGDTELKRLLNNLIQQARQAAVECDELLVHNGIMPPPSLPERPSVRLEEIPAGARFSDVEIALAIGENLTASLVACSQITGSSIRIDVGLLFSKYYALHLASSAAALSLSKEKGWLVPPPLQLRRPEH
ncbi:conserved hypothetical protein [Paenibacillus curdlanolyticus YK9]|uniref:DUF3231 family protein n=1 Tax=Paenibacillus curdlanolyticus YK9 TaxID=717606 RepID=E0I5Q0_9BACL|nr:DUF3231 family protein [Paenibacillus curdlanolyticus]EFM12292.1 conserved hypothetical protein [Paenibacillus curdlanolyticus YK9]